MKRIFRNKFQLIFFDEKKSFMLFSWQPKADKRLNDKKYLEQVNIGAEFIKKFKPENILVDYSGFSYPISPEIQIKVNDIILDAYEIAGVKKLALLSSDDLIEKMSLEQIIEERKSKHKFITQFFSNLQNATLWLENDN